MIVLIFSNEGVIFHNNDIISFSNWIESVITNSFFIVTLEIASLVSFVSFTFNMYPASNSPCLGIFKIPRGLVFNLLSSYMDLMRLAPSVPRGLHGGMPPVSVLHQPQLPFIQLFPLSFVPAHTAKRPSAIQISFISDHFESRHTHRHLPLPKVPSAQNISPSILLQQVENIKKFSAK